MLLKQEIQGTSRPFSRLLGFYLNCEHVLFVNILKQRRKKCCGFLNFFIIHKPSLWSRDVPQKQTSQIYIKMEI